MADTTTTSPRQSLAADLLDDIRALEYGEEVESVTPHLREIQDELAQRETVWLNIPHLLRQAGHNEAADLIEGVITRGN